MNDTTPFPSPAQGRSPLVEIPRRVLERLTANTALKAAAAASVVALFWVLWDSRESVSNAARLVLVGAFVLLLIWPLALERRAMISLRLARDDLRRKNKALAQSECKLKDVVGLANIGYWERDPVSGRVDWSEGAARIFGRQPPERGVTDAELLEMIHPDDRERRAQMLADAMHGQRLYDIEYRILRPDGKVRHVHVLENTNLGGPVRFGTVQDITGRRQAEIALRRSEQLLRETEVLGHTGSWEQSLVSGEIVNSAENHRLFFGDDRSKGPRLEDYFEAVHPDDRQYVAARRELLLAEGGPSDIEYRVVWPDGGVHVLFGRATVVRDASGRPVRVYGINVDITERKRADNAVREGQQLLEQVLATLPVGVIVTDRAGDVLLSNATAREIWGHVIASGTERRARSQGWWHQTGKPIAADEWASARAVSTGQTSLNELIDIESFDGKRKTIQNSAAPIRNARNEIVGSLIVNEEVTLRVSAERTLRETARRLQQLSRRLLKIQEDERRRLALELHDEFGQLLATINLRLHSALRAAGAAARPGLEETMALVQRAGEQVRSLALDLRPTMLESAGLDGALRWLAGQHQQRTGMATELVGHVGAVSGDAAIACFRVVQEALTNIVRHARATHVRIELRQTASGLDLAISDDGVGFNVDDVVGKAADRGRLGLLGMKERVQILGGGVDVISQPGSGTRVRMWLPLTEAARGEVAPGG